jgi:hypothetical protein
VAELMTRAKRTGTRFRPGKDFMWDTLLTLARKNPVDPALDVLAEHAGRMGRQASALDLAVRGVQCSC